MKKTLKLIFILFFSIIFIVTISFVVWASNGFFANYWLISKFENTLENSLGGSEVSIGDIQFEFFKSNSLVSATLFKIVLEDAEAKKLAYLNELEATFGYENLFQLDLNPSSLLVSNSTLVVTKNLEGDFSFEMKEAEKNLQGIRYNEVMDVIGLIDEIFDQKQLSRLSLFSARNTNIAFVDQKSGKTWWLNQGEFKLENIDQKLSAQFSANLLYGDDTTARAMLKLVKNEGEEVKLSVAVENIAVDQLSEQFPEFGFLSNLNLPISLSLSAVVSNNGEFEVIQGVLEAGEGSILFGPQKEKFFINTAKFYFEYYIGSEVLKVKQATFDTEYGTTVGSGNILIDSKSLNEGTSLVGQFEFIDTNLYVPKYFTKNLKINNILTDLKLDLKKKTLRIGQLIASNKNFDISSTGDLRFTDQGINGKLNFHLSDVETRQFAEMWPLVEGAKTKAWALRNINSGYLKNVTGEVSINQEENNNFYATFVFDETSLNLPEKISPVIKASGNGELGKNFFHINFEKGHIFSEPVSLMDVSGSSIRLLTGENENPLMNIRLNTVASVPSTLEILKDLPKDYRILESAIPKRIQGMFFAETDILFQLEKKLSETEIIFSTNAKIKSISADDIFGNMDLRAEKLSFFANNKEVVISGELDLDGNPVTGKWSKNFQKNVSTKSIAQGKFLLNKSLLSSLNINLSPVIISDEALADVSIQFLDGTSPSFMVKSDLSGLNLNLTSLDWIKKSNDKGELIIKGVLDQVPTITELSFSSSDLKINGKIGFRDYEELDSLVFTSVKFKELFDVSLEISKNERNTLEVKVLDGEVDLRGFNFYSDNNVNLDKVPELIQLESIVLSDSIVLTDLKAQFLKDNKTTGTFQSRINNGPAIKGSIVVGENGISLNINSDDAGAVLKSIGIFDNARKGDLDVILIPEAGDGVYNGELTVRNTRIVNAPALAELLSAVSVIGLLEQMDGQGLAFSESKANFSILSDKILIHDSSAIGASMGLTMQGEINPLTEEIDAIGVVTPFYAVNGIFEQTGLFAGLLGKKAGEGVFGFNYQMQGKGDKLKIDVNPLSILTPGVFRDLFNSPMPERTQ